MRSSKRQERSKSLGARLTQSSLPPSAGSLLYSFYGTYKERSRYSTVILVLEALASTIWSTLSRGTFHHRERSSDIS